MTANCEVFVVTCSSFAATISQLLIGQLGVTFGQNNACFDWLSSPTFFSRKKKTKQVRNACRCGLCCSPQTTLASHPFGLSRYSSPTLYSVLSPIHQSVFIETLNLYNVGLSPGKSPRLGMNRLCQ